MKRTSSDDGDAGAQALIFDSTSGGGQDGSELRSSAQETFGSRMRRIRGARGLTLEKLACRIGLTAAALSKWENDKAKPRPRYLPRLARALQVGMPELLGSPDSDCEGTSLGRASSGLLAGVILACKKQIADAAGVDPTNIKILIEV